jgi:hypothetical protein
MDLTATEPLQRGILRCYVREKQPSWVGPLSPDSVQMEGTAILSSPNCTTLFREIRLAVCA